MQEPHFVPAPVHLITSATEDAPSSTSFLMALSETPLQRHTYIAVLMLNIAFNIRRVNGWL